MTKPTEAEVEAAVIAVLTANYGAANVKKFWPDDLDRLVSGPPFSAEEWRSDMRAALTAAAQVRERVGDDLRRTQRAAKSYRNVARDNGAIAEAAIAEINRLRAALETIAALPDVRCDEAPNVARNTLNDGTRLPPTPAEPALMPIYGATEDQGPDVLGLRKGEE